MIYIPIVLMLWLAVHIIFLVESTYREHKEDMYDKLYYSSFERSLKNDNEVLIVTQYSNKDYIKVYYNGFFIKYDKDSNSITVHKKSVKSLYVDIDYFLAKINLIKGSSIEVKYLHNYNLF